MVTRRKKKQEPFPPIVYGNIAMTEWDGEGQVLIFHRNVGGVEHRLEGWDCDCSPILIPAEAYPEGEVSEEDATAIAHTFIC